MPRMTNLLTGRKRFHIQAAVKTKLILLEGTFEWTLNTDLIQGGSSQISVGKHVRNESHKLVHNF